MFPTVNDRLSHRERLREKGQFWTPEWIAEAMAGYVLGAKTDHVFDHAVGAGAFFKAAKKVQQEVGTDIELLGIAAMRVLKAKADGPRQTMSIRSDNYLHVPLEGCGLTNFPLRLDFFAECVHGLFEDLQ